MGMWDLEPYDNDAAADWLDDLIEASGIRDKWLAGIRMDPTLIVGLARRASPQHLGQAAVVLVWDDLQ